uniref:arylamine N-acetyltransferase n=1 Tax=Neogobius melanostomus TaxID=47308 RepID=A0A8C6WVA2_9GOBI
MDVQAYLSRYGCEVPAEPSLDELRSLHVKHLMSVPFEDLTSHSGGRVVLDLSTVYDKIVNQRQGGSCFENNIFITGCYDPPCSHMVLMVMLDGKRWLCDVGYGVPGFFLPMSLETDDLQLQGHRVYRIRLGNGMSFLECQKERNNGLDGDWTIIYKFTLEPRLLDDFTDMCHFHQALVTPCYSTISPGGRINYVGHKLTITIFPTEETKGGLHVETRELQDEEIPEMLEEKFGLKLKCPLVPKDEPGTQYLLLIQKNVYEKKS